MSVKSNPLQLGFCLILFFRNLREKNASGVLGVSASLIWSRNAGASYSFTNIFRNALRNLGVQSYLCEKKTNGK